MSGIMWQYRGFELYSDHKPFPMVQIGICAVNGLEELDVKPFPEELYDLLLNGEYTFKGCPNSRFWDKETKLTRYRAPWVILMTFTDERKHIDDNCMYERCTALDERAKQYVDRLLTCLNKSQNQNRSQNH